MYYSFLENGKPYDLQAESIQEVISYLEENYRSDYYDIVSYEDVPNGAVEIIKRMDINGTDADGFEKEDFSNPLLYWQGGAR